MADVSTVAKIPLAGRTGQQQDRFGCLFRTIRVLPLPPPGPGISPQQGLSSHFERRVARVRRPESVAYSAVDFLDDGDEDQHDHRLYFGLWLHFLRCLRELGDADVQREPGECRLPMILEKTVWC